MATLEQQEAYAVEAFKLCNEGKYEELQKHLQLYPKCVSAVYSDFKYSLLHYAVEQGNLPIVKLLLGNGASINQLTTTCFSPLYLAAAKDQKEILRLLLEKGANPNEMCLVNNRFNPDIDEKLRTARRQGSTPVNTFDTNTPTITISVTKDNSNNSTKNLKPEDRERRLSSAQSPSLSPAPPPQGVHVTDNTLLGSSQQPVSLRRDSSGSLLGKLFGSQRPEYVSGFANSITHLLSVPITSSPNQFLMISETFQMFDHANKGERKGENYPKDIQQLNANYSDWLVRLCNDKVFDEALFAAWLYLKLKQYEDRRVRTVKSMEQDRIFLKYMIDSITNESLQYATMDICFRVNQQLQANLMSALLHYFDLSLLSPRIKDMPPEDINLVFVLNLLKIYCDLMLESPTENLKMWVQRAARMLRMEDQIEKVFLEMAHSRFMLIGLKSIPEKHIPFMIHSALQSFKAPADPFMVVLPMKFFPLKSLKEDFFVNLAIEHFERLVEILPEGPQAQSLTFWMDVMFQLYKDLNIRSPALLSSFLYPVMLRTLHLSIIQAAAFKEVVVLHNTKEELEFIVNQDWNDAIHLSIANIIHNNTKLTPHILSRIPSKLMTTKETQQELMSFFQHYIEQSPEKAEAITAIAQLLDSFCVKESKQIPPEELFQPLYVICRACRDANKDFETWVAAFLGIAFVCPMFSRQFDPSSDIFLEASKKLFTQEVFVNRKVWVLDKLEVMLADLELKFAARLKFPSLYTLMLKTLGDLAVEGFLASSTKGTIASLYDLCWYLEQFMPQQRGTQSLSGLKLSIFNKVLSTISDLFGDIKFHLSREIALIFGLNMVNHGKKARLGGEQEACPFCSSSPSIPVTFVEEHFSLHTNKTSVVFIPGLGILWHSYLTGLNQLKMLFEDYVQSIREQNFTLSEAKLISECIPGLQSMALVCNIPFVDLPSPQLNTSFQAAIAEVEELRLVGKWLRLLNVPYATVDLPPSAELPSMSLSSIIKRTAGFKHGLALPEGALALLKLFMLLDALTSQFKDPANEITIADVAPMARSTKQFFALLLDSDKVRLSDLHSLHELLRQHTNNFANALNTAPYCFKTHLPDYKQNDVDRVVILLSQGFELLKFYDDLPYIVNCLQFYKLCEGDAQKLLTDHLTLKLELPNIPVSKVGTWLTMLQESVADMPSTYLKYFQYVHRGSALVDFLRGVKDFQEHVDLLTGKLQGDRFGLALLNDLVIVREMVYPFLSHPVPLRKFCAHIIERMGRFPDPEELGKKIEKIRLVEEQLGELQKWFSIDEDISLDATSSFISRLWKSGHCISLAGKTPGIYLLLSDREGERVDSGKEISECMLQELTKTVPDSQGLSRNTDLQEFKQAYKLAQDIHSLHVLLEASGHPDYQARELRIPQKEEGFMKLHIFEKRALELRANLEKWTVTIEHAHEKAPRLLLLNTNQLSSLIVKLSQLHKFGKITEHSQSILAIIPVCFPEFHDRPEISGSFIVETCLKFVTETSSDSLLDKGSDKIQPASYLQAAARIVKHIEDHLTLLGIVPEIYMPPKAPEILIIRDIDDFALFRMMVELNEFVPPHPVTLLQCTSSVTSAELERFLLRVEKFTSMRYFLVGVDSLTFSVQEILIKWISNLFSSQKQSQVGHLHLIFRENSGTEVLSFLKCEEYTTENIVTPDTLATIFMPSILLEKRRIDIFECLSGYPGRGKTTYIRRVLKENQIEKQLCISVNEDFSINNMLRTIQKVKLEPMSQTVIGVHFNISAYAPFELIAKFFYNFVLFGFLWDEASGDMEFMPEDIHWHIYVELDQPAEPDRRTVDDISDLIPAVKQVAQFSLDFVQAPLAITPDVVLSLSFLDMFLSQREHPISHALVYLRANKHQFSESEDDPATLHDKIELHLTRLEEEKGILVPRKNSSQALFFRLLADRCHWLQHYSSYIFHLMEESPCNNETLDSLPPQLLFDTFLLESTKLCDNSLCANLSQNSTVFSSRVFGKQPYVDFLNVSSNTPPVGLHVFNKEECVSNNGAPLRNFLAPALSLTNTNRMHHFCNAKKFVLTPDLAAKFLVVHERLRIGQSVILSGDTGMGKTEMMDLYAIIINADSTNVPDLSILLFDFVFEQLLLLPSRTPRIPEMLKYLTAHEDGSFAPNFPRNDAAILAKLVSDLCELVIPVEQLAQAKDLYEENKAKIKDNTVPFAGLAVHLLVNFVSQKLKQFPIIQQTPLLQRAVGCKQPADFILDQKVEEDLEVAIRSRAELSQLISDFLSAKFHNLFYRFTMNHQVSAVQFKSFVRGIINDTRQLRTQNPSNALPGVKVVCFLEELNATSIMGTIKEVFADRTLDGDSIPQYIVFVGALKKFDRSDPLVCLEPPPSLNGLVLNFGSLVPDQESAYISALINMRYDNKSRKPDDDTQMQDEERSSLIHVILFAHKFIKQAGLEHTSVSLRDITYALDIYHFLRFTEPGIEVIKILTNILESSLGSNPNLDRRNSSSLDNRNSPNAARGNNFSTQQPARSRQLYIHWQTLIISLALCYYFRLPIREEKKLKKNKKLGNTDVVYDRTKFEEEVEKMMWEHICPEDLTFKKTVSTMLNAFYAETSIPDEIARTDALAESIFCLVMCIENNIPVLLVGPPGCGKTLSMAIVADNMKGKASMKRLYTFFHAINPFRYQSSKFSTAIELQAVYKSASQRQETYNEDDPFGSKIPKATVIIEEANEQTALKTVSSHFDHPKVTTVVLSNTILDSSITSRAILIQQPATSISDLHALALGCIFGDRITHELGEHLLEALCDSYMQCNQFAVHTLRDFFHLRDFVYFLRYLRQKWFTDEDEFSPHPMGLLRGLQRNFNGIHPDEFRKLVELFFNEINEKLEADGYPEWDIPENIDSDTFVELIEDSLSEALERGENPNTSPMRHVLVIDHTLNEASVDILFSHNLCDVENTIVCRAGDFPCDATESVRNETVLRVKEAMEKGQTVVLINSGAIQSCLYDVLNQHYSLLAVGDDGYENLGNYYDAKFERYSNLAIGAYTRPCIVHEDFKMIVHVAESELAHTPRAFINRFAKFRVSVAQSLEHKLHVMQWEMDENPVSEPAVEGLLKKKPPTLSAIRDGCEELLEQYHDNQSQGRLLYGVISEESIASFVLAMAERQGKNPTNTIEFPPAFKAYKKPPKKPSRKIERYEDMDSAPDKGSDAHTAGSTIDNEDDTEFEGVTRDIARLQKPTKLDDYVRLAMSHMLQLARPENIFFCRSLPAAYITEYLFHQEHLSFIRFFHHTTLNFFHYHGITFPLAAPPLPPANPACTNKWCVFTRTSSELLRIHVDRSLQKLLMAPLEDVDILLDKQDEFYNHNNTETKITKSFSEKRLKVISLRNIPSSAACEQLISKFVTSYSQRIIICIADMSVCTQNEVNFFRKTIDKFLIRQTSTRYFCVVVLHFPPELELGLRPCYNAIFTNHWDFMYIDSLGVTIDVDDDNQVLIDANPRTWIGKGFGLPLNISPLSIETTFSELFYQLLQQICDGLAIPPLDPRFIRFSDTFYVTSHGRFEFLKSILAKFPFLLKDIFAKFGSLLTSSLLNHITTAACEKLQKGRAGAQSLLRALARALLFLLSPVVSRFIQTICANYSIEPLAAVHLDASRQAQARDLVTLARLCVSMIDPPSLSDILNYNMTAPVSTRFSFPPQNFMYDFVSDYLLKLTKRAQIKLAQAHSSVTPDNFYAVFYDIVKRDRIAPVVAFINSHPNILRLFKEDFVKRTLHMHAMSSIWLDACVLVLDGLCTSRSITDVCGLFVAKKFDGSKIGYLNICLRPLLELKSPENLKLPDQKTMANVLTPANVESLILVMTVEILWGRLEEIRQKVENSGNDVDEYAVELMANWCHVFRSLRYRLKFRRNLSSILPLTELARFDLQMCTFLFALNFSVSPLQLLRFLQHKDVQRIWTTILERSQKDVAKYRGLADVLPLLATLWKVLCIENGIIEHRRGHRSEKEKSETEKFEGLATVERKLRSNSAMMDRSDSWEKIEKRARASSALSSMGTGSGLTGLGGGLTGLTGISGLSVSGSSSELGSGQRSARSDSRNSNDSFTSNSERGEFLEGDGSEYGEVEDYGEKADEGPKVDLKKLEAHGGHFLRDVLSYYLLIDKHPQKDYTRAELKFFIESVKVFFSACIGTCVVEGLEKYWKMMWRSIPKFWIIWTVHGILSDKPKKWRTSILGEAAMLLFQTKKEGYTYIPQPLGKSIQSTTVLEDALFYVYLAKYEVKFNPLKLEDICQKYLKLDQLMQGPLITRSIHQAAVAILVLKKLAVLLTTGSFAESVAQLPSQTLSLLQSLLGAGGGEKETGREEIKGRGRPTSAALYMLQLIQPGSQLLQVLQARETLKKLGLIKWFVGESEALKNDFAKAVQSNHTVKSIVDAQSAQAKRFSSPLTSFAVFREYVTSSQSRVRAPSDAKRQLEAWNTENIEALGGNRKKLLPFFMDEQARLCALGHLPTLVQFYNLLNETFEYKITQKEAGSMTVPQCIEKLDKEGGLQVMDTILALKHSWAEFKIAWGEINTSLAETESRSDQNENKKSELHMKDVDDSTLFGTLVTHAEKALDVNDEIFRVINLLVQKQNQVLLKRNYYHKWNEHCLIFEENPEVIDVGQLLTDSDKHEMLVTANYNQTDFQTFILSNMTTDDEFSHSSVKFDMGRIKRQILEQFTCGKYMFTTTNFRHVFRFKVDIEEDKLEISEHVVHLKPTPSVLQQHLSISPLRKFAHGLKDGPYTHPLNEYDKKLLNTYKIKGDEDILPAAALVHDIIGQIMLHDPNYAKPDTTGEHEDTRLDIAAEEWLHMEVKKIPPLLRNLRHMPLARIRELALLIIQDYQKKDYLFSHLPAKFASPLSQGSRSLLKDLESEILLVQPPNASPSQYPPVAQPLHDWLRLLGGLKDAVLRIVKEDKDGKVKLKGDERLDSLVNPHLLDFGVLRRSDLFSALPPSILVSQLISYIRFLHSLCGNLQVALVAASIRKPITSENAPRTPRGEDPPRTPRGEESISRTPRGEENPPQALREDDPVPQPADLLLNGSEKRIAEKQAAEPQPDTSRDSLSRNRSYSRMRMPSFAFSRQYSLSRQATSSDFFKNSANNNNNNYNFSDISLTKSWDFSERRHTTSSPAPPNISSFSFSTPHSAVPQFSTGSPRSTSTTNLLGLSIELTKPKPSTPSSNAQVVVKVTYNKTVYGSREKRTNLMNMLYEKLSNKIREDFVLTTDDQEIIERTSTATFDEFLRDSTVTEINLTAVPFDHVMRVRVSCEGTQWECLTLSATTLNAFRELVAQHYQLNSSEFSLIPSTSPSHDPMPHRDDISLGGWASALLTSSSSSSSSPQLLLLELSMDVAVRVEKRSDVLFLSEKAQATIQVLYSRVSEWQRKPVSTFFLSNNGILLGRQALEPISSLPINNLNSMVLVKVLEADTVVKIFVVHPDHKTVLFGFSPDSTINDIWPDLAGSFPHDVIFPYGCSLVESDMREMFAKNWQKAGLSSAVLVLEVLLESETIEVFVEIDDAMNPMLSRFGTLVGDIFSHFIHMEDLHGYKFVGHNDTEIKAHEGDWTMTIYDYVEHLKTTDDVDRVLLRARKKAAFQVVIAGEVYSFPYDDPSFLTNDNIVASVRSRFQLPAVSHYVCNAEGIVLLGTALTDIAKSRSYLRLATKSELRNISVNNIKLTIMRTTTAEALTAHLHHARTLDAELDAVCTRERIMLAYEQPIPPDMDLVIVAKSKLLSKNVEFEDRSARVSALPQVDLALILKYVRHLFAIPADVSVELSEKETGFALALELTFDSAEGDIVVQHV